MHEASGIDTKSETKSKVTMFVSGTLIAILAGGIGMQIARVKEGKAVEVADPAAGQTTVDAGVLGKPVSRVNGESIPYQTLAQECIERHGKDVLENVINRTLIQQACAQAGISVSEAEVNVEIVRISKKFGLPVDQWEKMLQAERGLSPIQYRRDVIWPMLALRKLAGQEIQITREQMQEAYVDNYGPRVKARMMVLDNLRRATEIVAKLKKNPEEFENFARDYSVEPNSRALGGSIPPIRRHSCAHEQIREAAFRLKTPGEISGIVQVSTREYVILKFEGMTEPVEHDPKDVEAQLHEELREREVQTLVAKTFEQLKEKSRIDNFLTGESHSPIQQTAGAFDEDEGITPAFQLSE